MKKLFVLVAFAAVLAFAQEIVVGEGEIKTLRNKRFENFSGDFVIKNHGFLLMENCTLQNNILGSKNSAAKFVGEKSVVAPIVNFGKLSLVNCVFIDNFSWNTAITENFEAQVAAGAVANFGELTMSNDNVFQNNAYQKGQFTVIRNSGVERIFYVGSDSVFNRGAVEFLQKNEPQNNRPNLDIEAAIMENPVSDKAQFFVKTNRPTNVRITVSNALGNVMFSDEQQINGSQIIEWNLHNQGGNPVAAGAYLVRFEAENYVKMTQLGVRR